MSNYPFSFDSNITLPGVSGSSQEDAAITALRSAVFAIEVELGVTPSGVYPDVRTRLDILESRILFSTSAIEPDILNDGYVKSPLFIYNVPQNIQLSISDGIGAPTENRLDGSLYMRGVDGYANNQLYVRLNGAWHAVQTEQFTATHDLTGFPSGTDGHLGQTVIGLYNHPFRTTMNTVGATQDGYHVTWNNVDGYWEAQTGFIPTHDLAAFSGPYGRTGQIVTGIQNSHVSPVPPTDGQSFVWVASDAAWVPQHRAVVFSDSSVLHDGYVLRTNIASNKLLQSPSATSTGKIGMVNFGSRSTGATTGTTDNYAAILSGDQNTASGVFSTVVSGLTNTASALRALVVNGSGNTASNQGAVVVNGLTNTASGVQSIVVDGYSNTASGNNSFVLSGGNNAAGAIFSGILNGISNTIASGATHSGIGWGQFNVINAAGISSVILGGSGNQVFSPNVLIGTAIGASVSSNNSSVLNGIGHTIGTASDHSVIISGNTHTISAASGFAFIGAGNNLTATGLYATILNSTGGLASGVHSLLLNGNSNSVTGPFSTIVNGRLNTILLAGGTDGYATILDGYNHNITGAGSLIGDGYNHSISGQYSSILNGNFNVITGKNSTILNGSNHNINVNSSDITILSGNTNVVTDTTNATISGNFNSINAANNTYILGSVNSILSPSSKVIGSSNTITAGGAFNRVFGNFNTLGSSPTMNSIFGNANTVGPAIATHDNVILGSNNIVDGFGTSTVAGQSNIAVANLTNTAGQYAKSRMFGQEVRANGRFTGTTVAGASIGATLPQATINVVSTVNFPASGTIAINTTTGLQTVSYTATTATSLTGCTGGTGVMSATSGVGKIGEAQWSRLILDGYSTSVGAAVPLQLQDTVLANPTFVDGYSYDMSIKLLIVNTTNNGPGVGQNPTVPARYYIDVLAHQESGVLVIDNINTTLSTPNTVDSASRTPWTFSISPSGNQMILQVDAEVPSSYVQPNVSGSPSPSLRRAIATIDMREISRI